MTTLRALIKSDFSALGIEGTIGRAKYAIWCAGARATVLYRLQQRATSRGLTPLALAIASVNHTLHGCEFGLGCEFGPSLIIRHPTGIVVGSGVVAGSSCTLLHGVTLGELHADGSGDHLFPRIGNGITLCCGSSVLGDVVIGDGAVVGAHALVMKDVAESTVVGGVPAKVVTTRHSA
jgi:serine O-acetyltransferase